MQYLKNLGHYSQLGAYRKLPKLKLHSTMNTIVTCPVCRGGGTNVTNHGYSICEIICPHCKGRKVYCNRMI